MLRALKRGAAALVLAAFFATGAAAVVVASRDRPQRASVPRLAVSEPDQPRETRAETTGSDPGRGVERRVRIRWRRSVAIGLHWRGRLVRGVELPAEGLTFFTWDPILRRSPNRAWRRWGTNGLVRTVLRVLDAYAVAHPGAPRVGVGDLSRPHGGDFGPRYGRPGHVSHQNGLDVDVYYPRLDGRERAPIQPAQIDRRLAQALVDRFVAAGAIRVFVGPNTRLRGPPEIVQALPHHDNHLHVRLAGN